eukprot:UN26039
MVKNNERLYSTIGVHPTNCNKFSSDEKYLDKMLEVCERGVKMGKIVAVGECGLEFNKDRLEFCSKETQLKHFHKHLVISEKYNLPLFYTIGNQEKNYMIY